jgi:hypothetical protein
MGLLLHPQIDVFILLLLHHHLSHYVRVFSISRSALRVVINLLILSIILAYILINDLSSEQHVVLIRRLFIPLPIQTLLQQLVRVADLLFLFLILVLPIGLPQLVLML